MTRSRFAASLTAILLLAIALRGLFPAADPPWRSTVGVVWHDEGAWVHDIHFRGLTFAHANWLLAPEGQSFPQAEIGLSASARAIRSAVARLPRP